MSSIVTPDCRRSISTTRSCLLCEGTIRPLALAVEVFRALPRDFATAVLRRRGMLAAAWEGLVSCVSLMPRARSPLLVMNRPRGRRSSSHAIQARRGQSVALPRAYACTRFRPRCRARRPWLRLCGKGRSDPSARCAAALKITCWASLSLAVAGWVFDMTASIVVRRPDPALPPPRTRRAGQAWAMTEAVARLWAASIHALFESKVQWNFRGKSPWSPAPNSGSQLPDGSSAASPGSAPMARGIHRKSTTSMRRSPPSYLATKDCGRLSRLATSWGSSRRSFAWQSSGGERPPVRDRGRISLGHAGRSSIRQADPI